MANVLETGKHCLNSYTDFIILFSFKAVPGINKIQDGYNPATWMLEVTSSSQELILGVDFTALYQNSDLYK